MPLLFTHFCDLLSALEDYSTRDPPLLPLKLRQKNSETIKSWFTAHPVSINSPEVDTVALLSALFPAKRTDRVYCIKPPSLTRSLRRWLGLGSSRWPLLDQWQTPDRGDLSDCVERVLQQAEFPVPHNRDRVTLDQVDNALATVAARCRFSAPRVRAREMDKDDEVGKALENVYQRLQSREAKWFTRLILKDFSRLEIFENLVYHCIDPRLRVAMQMYHDFESAVSELRSLPASQIVDPASGGFTQQCANDAHLLPPRIGVKLGPPKWIKAKGGVKHAVSIIDGRTMSVERKHDGEYCQIHIDLSKGEDCIQIFSKSGKDSTQDRKAVHQAIKDGLRIGRSDCMFSSRCILDGELLVYSDRTKEILEFHKIRKHVSRSGSFLGTTLDSQPHYWEHLMIMYYDVMLIDDDPVLHRPHGERRRLLRKLVKPIEGRADCTYHARVRFSKPEGPDNLKQSLALAFVRRWEGLVLKPYDEPYLDLVKPVRGRYPSRWIKLKKDCIKGLGDTADFAVIGGGYDAGRAAKFILPNIRWTHFYIGCLRNKANVLQFGVKPLFLVFDEISDCIKREDMKTLNELGRIREMAPDSHEAHDLFHIEYASGIPKPIAVFRCPFVFDVAGSGFARSPNRDIFTLRFPRVMKVHWDRNWKDAVGLDELQRMATEARTTHSDETSKPFNNEIKDWIQKLNQLDRGAQGQLTAWDFSDNDAEDDGLVLPAKEPPAKAGIKAQRRSRASAAPPFVRMDTAEMHNREWRLSNGEVVERPTSKHSMDSITSDGSLQTPPTSSPLSRSADTGTRQQFSTGFDGHTHSEQRKRSADTDLEGSLRRLKKARPQLRQQSRSEPQTNHCSMATISKPLHEITNNARSPIQPQFAKPSQQTKASTTSDFTLVRKLPLGADEFVHQKYEKPRVIMEPSSPGRETTATPSTAAPTTQGTVDHHIKAIHNSPTPKPKAKPRCHSPSLLTPPSTADPPLTIHIPDLQESKVVLSPGLIQDQLPIRPVQEQLASLSITSSSFRQALRLPVSTEIVASTVKDTVQIVVLVEPGGTKATRKAMFTILENVQIWHPISVAFWDWRILSVISNGDGLNGEDNQKVFENLFYAKMTWNSQWESHGAVEVRWRDGSMDRVLQKDLEERVR